VSDVGGVLRFVHLLALGVWIGTIAFFSFVVAPTVFAALGASGGGPVVSAIFPTYYAVGLVCGGLGVVTALLLARRARAAVRWRAAALVLAVGLGATAWAGLVVQPRAQALRLATRDAGPESAEAMTFRVLHRRAVLLNALTLVAALGGLGVTAATLRA